MVDFRDCMGGKAADDPDMDPDGKLREALDTIFTWMKDAPPGEREARAAEFLKKKLKGKRKAQAAQLAVYRRLWEEMQEVGKRGAKPVEQYAHAKLQPDYDGKYAKYGNVNTDQYNQMAVMSSMISEFFEEFMPTMFSRKGGITSSGKNIPRAKLLFKSLFSEDIKDPAIAALAKKWREMEKYVVDQYNRYGANVTFDPERQALVIHNRERIAALGENGLQAWKADIIERLDLAQMENKETGLPFTREEIGPILDDVHANILTDGAHSLKPEGSRMAFYERLDQSRFFKWKSFALWEEYNAKFGFGDDYPAAMQLYMMRSAKNIALLKNLGTDPLATTGFIKRAAGKITNNKANVGDNFDTYYKMATGDLNVPEKEWMAELGNTLRNLSRAAYLGMTAILQMATETVTTSAAANLNGFRRFGFHEIFPEFARAVVQNNKAERVRLAAQIGVVLDMHRHVVSKALMRDGVLPKAERWSALASEAVHRTTGTRTMMSTQQAVFGTEFMLDLSRNAGKAFADLNPRLAFTLQKYGVSEEEWMRLAKDIPAEKFRGLAYMNPAQAVTKGGEAGDLALKLLTMVNEESRMRGVLMSNPRTRRALTLGTRPGTARGELMRFSTDLMGYPVTYMMTNVFGRWKDPRLFSPMDRVGHNTIWAGATIMAAWGAYALYDLAAGKDAPAFDDMKAWGRAVAGSGAGGMFGEMINRAFHARDVKGFLGSLPGPVIQNVGNIGEALAKEALDTNDTYNPTAKLRQGVSGFIPGQNIWWAGLAINRLIGDTLEKELDPNAEVRWDRWDRKSNQERWWPRGAPAPQRMPRQTELGQ